MTLRNVIVLAPSGLVLFAKEYGKAVAQPRLLGSLLTAMTEFAAQTTAMRPSYIEMSSMAVTMVRDDGAKVSCALVHDRTDTASFGRLVASEILLAFVEEYARPAFFFFFFRGLRRSFGGRPERGRSGSDASEDASRRERVDVRSSKGTRATARRSRRARRTSRTSAASRR